MGENIREKYPYPYTMEEMESFKAKNDFGILKEIAVKKSEITKVAYIEAEKLAETYDKFMEIIHSYDCDIREEYNSWRQEYETKFFFEYEGKRRFGYLREADYGYLAPIGDEFNEKKNGFVAEDIIKIRKQLLEASDVLERQYKNYAKGDAGEEYVNKELDLIKDKYRFARNIKLQYADLKGNSSETDLYIVTSKGILVCEIKNIGNEKYVYQIGKDGQWTKNDSNGNFLEVINSPFSQNTRHCIATEKLLKDNGILDYKIIPVVIIGNEYVRINNDSSNAVIRASELYNYIEQLDLKKKYDETYQKEVIKILEENNDRNENEFRVHTCDVESNQLMLEYVAEAMKRMQELYDFAKRLSLDFSEKKKWEDRRGCLIIIVVMCVIVWLFKYQNDLLLEIMVNIVTAITKVIEFIFTAIIKLLGHII